jgi:hypothetical protein
MRSIPDELVCFPVSCPICRKPSFAEYRRSDVLAALINDRSIRLHASCCHESWTAGYIEMQQIRAFFGAARFDGPDRTATPKARELHDD